MEQAENDKCAAFPEKSVVCFIYVNTMGMKFGALKIEPILYGFKLIFLYAIQIDDTHFSQISLIKKLSNGTQNERISSFV